MDIKTTLQEIGNKAKVASRNLAYAKANQKRDALLASADFVLKNQREILEANAEDMAMAESKGLSSAMLDRLLLDESRIEAIARGLRNIANQDDPIGRVMQEWSMPTGLHIQRVSTPLGVIGVIYESRPNVTADAGALCLKAGNAAILRCGSESLNSSGELHRCMVQGLHAADLPADSIQLVPTRDRDAVKELLKMNDFIDVIVPRGGKNLVDLVQREARVPVFAHLEGIVHIYVDKDADLEKARNVIMNAKTRRPGICGAVECLLIDKEFYEANGASFVEDLLEHGVEVRADETLSEIKGTIPATQDDWGREYLDLIISAKIVDGVEGAISHIAEFGSNHTEAIISENSENVRHFFDRVDSSILMHNASTQFADGGEFGMGAEIGIATGKLHARGPVGAEQLTSFKYLVTGDGAVRE